LISQVYNSADPHIDDDVQFGVTQVTLADFVRHDEPHPTGSDIAGSWYSLNYTYVLERGQKVLPKPPIK
jgi:catechol 1,2-dioxygenase